MTSSNAEITKQDPLIAYQQNSGLAVDLNKCSLFPREMENIKKIQADPDVISGKKVLSFSENWDMNEVYFGTMTLEDVAQTLEFNKSLTEDQRRSNQRISMGNEESFIIA